MPYVPKFFYLPRNGGPNENDVFSQCENIWSVEGLNLGPNLNKNEWGQEKPLSFQDLPCEVQEKQMQYKKLLGILNKITTKKFKKLIMQMGPEMMDEVHTPMLAKLIFMKALSEDMFINLYACLCEEVSYSLASEPLETFNLRLKQLCLGGFDHLLELTDADIQRIDGDVRYVYKRRLMNLMRFIGEMSCTSLPLFSRRFNWHMIESLIVAGDELHLEAVYFILYTISRRSSDNSWPESVWSTVSKVSRGLSQTGGCVSSRIRFMFLSLVEARVGVLPPDHLPSQNTPSTSDSESNQQVSDYKGF